MARQTYYVEAAGPISTTSSVTWSDLVTLTETLEASSDYYFFWSFQQTNGDVNNDAQAQLWDDTAGVALVSQNWEAHSFSGTTDKRSIGGIYKLTTSASPAANTWKIRQKDESTNTCIATNIRLLILKAGANDHYAESTARSTTTSTTLQTKATLTFTPPSTQDYLLILSATVDTAISQRNEIQFQVGGTQLQTFSATQGDGIGSHDTTGRYPWVRVLKVNLDNTSHAITIKWASTAAGVTSGCADARILAIPVADFGNAYEADLAGAGTVDSGTQNTYQDVVALTQTPVAGDHLLFAAAQFNSSAASVAAHANLDFGGTSLAESLPQGQINGDAFSHFVFAKQTLTATATSWKLQRRADTGTTTTTAMDGTIAVLQLDTSSTVTGTLAATEGADAASFAGAVAVSGVMSGTDGADIAAFVGTVAASGFIVAQAGMIVSPHRLMGRH